MRMVLIDFRHPFFRPILRRIIVFALVVIWAGVEFFNGSVGWTVFFVALAVYIGWGFFLSGQPDEPLADAGEADKPTPPADSA
ncbi:hypothetical protein OEG84_23485 [Hoeflea sp. G2-23]|uniref:DUF3329 domain-containing protein n=1 Tax=Hoeflea algicola TaxID=2983763 RepID=A0ABT3ZFL7_9HYPH|nr:hypothetical protein [Hoeflea algicola]MCY0150584.1 hypothetical protein [Hoeflea algicola]